MNEGSFIFSTKKNLTEVCQKSFWSLQQNKLGQNLPDDATSPISSVITLDHNAIASLSHSYVQEHSLGHAVGFLFQDILSSCISPVCALCLGIPVCGSRLCCQSVQRHSRSEGQKFQSPQQHLYLPCSLFPPFNRSSSFCLFISVIYLKA